LPFPLPVTKDSLYLKAGAPMHCRACEKPFEGFCIRGDDDRYYCSEVCAQVGLEIDFDKVANMRKRR
jgi:hypothetical protein